MGRVVAPWMGAGWTASAGPWPPCWCRWGMCVSHGGVYQRSRGVGYHHLGASGPQAAVPVEVGAERDCSNVLLHACQPPHHNVSRTVQYAFPLHCMSKGGNIAESRCPFVSIYCL